MQNYTHNIDVRRENLRKKIQKTKEIEKIFPSAKVKKSEDYNNKKSIIYKRSRGRYQ